MNLEKFCKEYCVERKGTSSLKWDSLDEVFGDADLTPLWVADMEFKAPTAVIEAIKKRADHGAFGYGKVEDSYYEAFSAWQKKHHSMDVTKEDIRFYTGVVGALYAMVNTYTEKDDSVIICPPVYYPFYDAVLNTGRQLVTCELDNTDGYYTLDLAKFEKEIANNKVKMFILCSPHNPVSRVWTVQELEGMFEICLKHGVLVVSDEIHQDFTYSEEHKFVPASVIKDGMYKDMLLTLNSGSKTFNLAGLIHSHTIIFDEKLREKYDAYIRTIGQPEANIFGLTGMEAAFRYGEEWLENIKGVIRQNYDYVCNEFAAKAPKVIVTDLEGTYLTWIDLRAYVEPEKVSEFMQKKCRLAVDVGEWFSVNAHGFIRINLATNPKYVKLAIESILQNI